MMGSRRSWVPGHSETGCPPGEWSGVCGGPDDEPSIDCSAASPGGSSGAAFGGSPGAAPTGRGARGPATRPRLRRGVQRGAVGDHDHCGMGADLGSEAKQSTGIADTRTSVERAGHASSTRLFRFMLQIVQGRSGCSSLWKTGGPADAAAGYAMRLASGCARGFTSCGAGAGHIREGAREQLRRWLLARPRPVADVIPVTPIRMMGSYADGSHSSLPRARHRETIR
jgi:hypothetical protein